MDALFTILILLVAILIFKKVNKSAKLFIAILLLIIIIWALQRFGIV